MKIRAKLFFLVFGMIALLSGAASLYFVLQAPLAELERERSILDDLSIALRDLQMEANRLDSTTFGLQRPRFAAATDKLNASFAALGGVRFLRKTDAEVAEAIEIVERLHLFNSGNLKAVVEVYDDLYKDAEAVFTFPDSISFQRFYNETPLTTRDPKALTMARFHLSRFDSASGILNDSLESSYQVLLEQRGLIDARSAAIKSGAGAVAALLVAALVALAAVAAVFFANGIARNVIALASGVRTLAGGDLSARFALKSRDEIGSLSREMDGFIEGLEGAILTIKDAAGRNADARERLLEAARATESALEELRAATREVDGQARTLDEKVSGARKAVEGIAAGAARLDSRIADQIAMVEESTAAITQMLATIGSMAKLSEKDRVLSDELVRTSDTGREVFTAAFEKVDAIAARAGEIEEMVEIIDSIASQTNLLAMNAAIEAAHAGEAGKGFAVVSDEIRKLAEASAEGSQQIASSVRAIVDSIASAKQGSAETNKAFGDIEEKIRDVSRSVSEISQSLVESDEGGRQILTAMTALRELSSSIAEESAAAAEGARSIGGAMGDLDAVAAAVRASLDAIGGRSDLIAEGARRTGELAEGQAAVGRDLDAGVSRFRTSRG